METIKVLDHGYVTLLNLAGPTRRPDALYDADDTDPANVARMSFDGSNKEGRTREEDLKLNEYLAEHDHTTPFEMIECWVEMKMPIFVARQFVRHRTVSINEVSARYTKLPADFYIPDPKTVGVKSKSNKQGRDITNFSTAEANIFCDNLRMSSMECYERYEGALRDGIPPELARCFLPLNIYTKWIWNQDLHNIMHFLSKRLPSDAQYEARMYGNAIFTLLLDQLPSLMGSFYKRKISK